MVMVMDSPFRLTVYDKTFTRKGWVGNPVALIVTPRHNALGTATLTVDSDHRRLPDLVAPGARVVVEYTGEQVLSGPVVRLRGKGPTSSGQVEVDVDDDWRLLKRVQGWPVPAAALNAQTDPYDVQTGPAETVLKHYVHANAVTRLGLPVTVAPDLGRGATISTSLRFHPLADRLYPAVEQAGLGVTVRQQGAGLVVDVYEPATYPRTLSERSGVVTEWGWSSTAPGATRVVAGDQGEGAARNFTSTTDTARETAWGDVIETFVDARDTDDPLIVGTRRDEALAAGAPKAGLRVTLSETASFRYGQAVHVGDRVRLEVGPGVVVYDVLREAALSWTRDGGWTAAPAVGDRTDDPDLTLARAVAALAADVRDLRAGR